MRQQSKPSEKKQANFSFDAATLNNQNGGTYINRMMEPQVNSTKHRGSLFPQTTQHAYRDTHKKQITQPTTVSPNTFKLNDSVSPQRRLFSSKRQEIPKIPPTKSTKNQSLNSTKNLAITNQKRPSQHQKKDNLTIKTGQSIEALKEFLNPIQQQVLSCHPQTSKSINSQIKNLLQTQTQKNSTTQKNPQFIDSRSRRKILNITESDYSQLNDSQEKAIGGQKFELKESTEFLTGGEQTGNSFIQQIPQNRGQSQHNRTNSKDNSTKPTDQKFAYHRKNQSYQIGQKNDETSQLILQQISPNSRNFSSSNKSVPKMAWNDQKLPLSPQEVIEKFSMYLTELEKVEILGFKRIYCIGIGAKKSDYTSQYNEGYDDVNGEYTYANRDHIGYRYEILEPLGKGSFGQVLKVFDHKKQSHCAVKIIKNKKKFQNQALVELNILTFIKEKDEENLTNVVKISDFVIFRSHVCIAFELLSMNLYELIKSNNYQGLSLELIRRFAIQILNALNFLHKQKIVHCDLKPENILLKQANKSGIKIVDFGSSCFEHERVYSYIQSRYYRSPEVILGLPYEMSIDMWSFGCIMAELYMGYPLFPGENEQEQMAYIMEIIGLPTDRFIEMCPRKKYFFSPSSPFQALPFTNTRGKTRLPNTKELKHVLGCNDIQFIDFLSKCFVWESEKRLKPLQALMHNWILEGLPLEIRVQHIKYLESEQQSQKILVKQTRKLDINKSINQGDQGQQHSQNQNHSEKNSEPLQDDFNGKQKQKQTDRQQDYSVEKPSNKPQDRPRNPTQDKGVDRSIERPKPLDAQNTLLNLLKTNDGTPQQKKLNSLHITTGKANNSFHVQQRIANFPTSTKNDPRSNQYNQMYFH